MRREAGPIPSAGPPPHVVCGLAREALLEDLGPGDVTTDAIVGDGISARAVIETRQAVVVSGTAVAVETFRLLDEGLRVLEAASEGARLPAGGTLLSVAGKARALLKGERTALNFLGHLCGVATMTRACVEAASRGGRAAVTDTRKTTPGLRALEKAAVRAGGGSNHRFGLWDAVLVKDNHIDLAGGVRRAVALAREAHGRSLTIETEVRSILELEEALEAGADAVLLDNFSPDQLRKAVELAGGRLLIEVSGGVTLERLPQIAALGVDRISVGSLTHSAPSADLTMRTEPWTS